MLLPLLSLVQSRINSQLPLNNGAQWITQHITRAQFDRGFLQRIEARCFAACSAAVSETTSLARYAPYQQHVSGLP